MHRGDTNRQRRIWYILLIVPRSTTFWILFLRLKSSRTNLVYHQIQGLVKNFFVFSTTICCNRFNVILIIKFQKKEINFWFFWNVFINVLISHCCFFKCKFINYIKIIINLVKNIFHRSYPLSSWCGFANKNDSGYRIIAAITATKKYIIAYTVSSNFIRVYIVP